MTSSWYFSELNAGALAGLITPSRVVRVYSLRLRDVAQLAERVMLAPRSVVRVHPSRLRVEPVFSDRFSACLPGPIGMDAAASDHFLTTSTKFRHGGRCYGIPE